MMDAHRNLVDGPWGQNPALAAAATSKRVGLDALTAREREVVQRAVSGNSNKSIAFDLGIADATVRVLLWRAYGKLGVRSRRDLIAKAFVLGQLEASEQSGGSELEGQVASGG